MGILLYANFWENALLTIIGGSVAGVISAYVFYLLMRYFKPVIEISEKIVKERLRDDRGQFILNENGEYIYEYLIKIINKTKSDIEDVSYQLFILEDYFKGDGKIFELRELEFKKNNKVKSIAGVKNKDKEKHNNCRLITIKGDLEKEWDKNREWVEFQIESYHSKSGSRKVHKQIYIDRHTNIVEGYFKTGHCFEIIRY